MRQQRAFCFLVTLLALLPLAAAAAAGSPAATVQRVSGTLTVRRQGVAALAPLAARGALYVGDLVGTGPDSRASLLFRDGSQARLNANSAIEVLPPTSVGRGYQGLFRAVTGEVWSRLRPGKAVQTPSAIGGVRGTEFHLRVGEDDTVVLTVLDGAVDFFNEHGAVEVGQSQQSTARPGNAPTAPVTIDNPGLIIEWTLDLGHALVAREQSFVSTDPETLAAEVQRRGERARAEPGNVEARREYGDALFDAGRRADALIEYQESARLAQDRPEVLSRAGDALLALGRLEEARASYEAALARDGDHLPARIGLAWEALLRNRPTEAEEHARTAGEDTEAQSILGLALMRQPGKQEEARQALQAAALGPGLVQAQARSWLAMMLLARDDREGALREAEAATEGAPRSAVARGNLALVHFYGDRPADAEREARAALRVNPECVAALCALGQAQLASGDVDRAARTAARAVGLDPAQAQAHYLMGIADAQRRDYRHAARALEESLRLAPGFLPAASALARVYTKMGRNARAVAVLEGLLPGARSADQVRMALGGVHYQQGDYAASVESYREALKLKPNSALAWAELARVLIDANRLDEAIEAGRQAVHLAPGVGQYHAVLGLAYDHGKLTTQADREYRTALALDPRNALAHLQLGLKAAQWDPAEHRIFPKRSGQSLTELLRDGMRATGSGATGSITQALLYDPAVPAQVLRGGTSGEITPSGGSDTALGVSVLYRAGAASGFLGTLAVGSEERDEGMRPNDDSGASILSGSVTYRFGSHTDLFARASYHRDRQGLPGPVSQASPDDRSKARNTALQLAIRQRIGASHSLWVGLSGADQRLEIRDPLRDSRFLRMYGPEGVNVAGVVPEQRLESTSIVPEARLELGLSRSPARRATLTLGAAHATLNPRLAADVYMTFGPPPVVFPFDNRLDGDLSIAYAQWTQRLGGRATLAAQLRYQRLAATTRWRLMNGDWASAGATESHLLPSLAASYRAGANTWVRLFYNHQAQEQELAPTALAPRETLLSTEPLVATKGSPGTTRTAELDVERTLSGRDFLKLFLFETTARQVNLGDLPQMDSLRRAGLGLRYERQITGSLCLQAAYAVNRTTNRTAFAPFDGGVAPYHPQHFAGAALSYVDRRGNRAELQLSYAGHFHQDTGILSDRSRPIFPAQTYVDLSLAREPSVRYELFLKVLNVFDHNAIRFAGYPTGRRRVLGGATYRF